MKRRWSGRQGGPGRMARTALSLALVLALAAAAAWSVPAAVDTGKACSLTVAPGPEDMAAGLAEAQVVTDLYLVAEALPLPGSDGYTFGPAGAFAGLAIPQDIDTDGWDALAQEAARTALAADSTAAPVITGEAAGTRIGNLRAGLYLLVARGSGLESTEEYVKTVTGEDGTERIATVAYSRTDEYTFMPELVALPTRAADEDGYVGTDAPGDWIYDLDDTMLKPEQAPRYGDLMITKNLDTYETQDPATFVFQVDAYTDETMAERVYSDVVSLTFTEPGTKQTLIEGRLPVGSYVVVTEVYSGSSYGLTTEAEQTAVIEANETVSVGFSNTYTGNRRGGHGITNAFTYSEEGGSWRWEQLPDNATE